MHLCRADIRRGENMGSIVGGGPQFETRGAKEGILANKACERSCDEGKDDVERFALCRTAWRQSGSRSRGGWVSSSRGWEKRLLLLSLRFGLV